VSTKCAFPPKGHERGIGSSVSGLSRGRARRFTHNGRSGSVSLLPVFCLLAAGCGLLIAPVSMAATMFQVSARSEGNPDSGLRISASSLSFGNVTDGSSETQAIKLSSTGSAKVTIESVMISGAGFSFSGSAFPVTLSHHKSVTLEVTFAPATPGAAMGALIINSAATSNFTSTVNLSGNGVAANTPPPAVTVSTSSLSFGTVDDDSSATLPVTLTSTGATAVTINSATISGTGFSYTGATFPLTLSPQQAVTLEVTFAPTQGVAETGSLTISSNTSTNSTAIVSLSGSGQYWVALSWSAPGSSPVPVTGYNVYRATGGSSTYTLVNPTVISGTSYSDASVQNGVQYSYYVESVDASGTQSSPSQSVSVTIP